MLILTPKQPIYFLARDGDYGYDVGSFNVRIDQYSESITLSIRDARSNHGYRYVTLTRDKKAAIVYLDIDNKITRCYISLERDGQIGIDAPEDKVRILRRNHMLASSFKPLWDNPCKVDKKPVSLKRKIKIRLGL